MVERYLHRHDLCHTRACLEPAIKHYKLYWHTKGPIIHSALFCRRCWNLYTTALPLWEIDWESTATYDPKYFKTLTACRLDLITKSLS